MAISLRADPALIARIPQVVSRLRYKGVPCDYNRVGRKQRGDDSEWSFHTDIRIRDVITILTHLMMPDDADVMSYAGSQQVAHRDLRVVIISGHMGGRGATFKCQNHRFHLTDFYYSPPTSA